MTTLALTGATGFLGSEIAKRACQEGYRVVALCRKTSKREHLKEFPIVWKFGDVCDSQSMTEFFKGVDFCIHSAGDTSYYIKDLPRLERVNVEGTRNVIGAAKAGGVKRVVHTSSVAAIGFDPRGNPVDETCAYNWPSGLPYMETKCRGERVARTFLGDGFELVTVNPATIMGPGNMNASEEQMVREVETGKVLCIPPGGMTVCDVEDVARAHFLALEKGRTGERYILGGHHVSHQDLLKMLAQELQVPLRAPHFPAWTLATLGSLLKPLERVGIDVGTSAAVIRLSRFGIYHSSEKAKSELGYSPRPLVETVQRIVAYRKQNKVTK